MPMTFRRSLPLVVAACLMLAACGADPRASSKSMPDKMPLFPGESHQVRTLINKYADHYQVPRTLVHKVVQRESGYNPVAKNGRYMGLMQIDPRTANTMGFSGSPQQLLDAETNLKYAIKYLRGAWLVADGSESKAIGWYANGYYYEAKKRGVLGQLPARD
ncbi:hypothetical protein CG50_03080 [Paenirhodobacter enshiensis]|uniref:Transglycosylase SLT domain-containing protein n=2 Tax=Paenirhodobacter enshiensis TaxID=1105367 RepID=A0A086Y8W1_9RHOB|nr:hypothetical protein CG50_03080 [Paenirhodobacter enshiensis]